MEFPVTSLAIDSLVVDALTFTDRSGVGGDAFGSMQTRIVAVAVVNVASTDTLKNIFLK